MRQALIGSKVERGVWVSPFLGKNGETVLVAVTRRGWTIADRHLKPGEDHVGASDELWAILDDDDPERLRLVI